MVPPALLAMATLLQAYHGMSDAEAKMSSGPEELRPAAIQRALFREALAEADTEAGLPFAEPVGPIPSASSSFIETLIPRRPPGRPRSSLRLGGRARRAERLATRTAELARWAPI
jgi:hypothetical protein